MAPATPPTEGTGHRPSRVVAEALVKRWGPKRIAVRANRLGFPPPLTASPEHGAIVLIVWTITTVVAAAWMLHRRDAR